jgi:hypothetical protein
MAGIPGVSAILSRIQSIHEKKNEDYATDGKSYENFERASVIAAWFNDPIDKTFVTLIGVKLARLAVLRNKKSDPNNESIEDTFLDLATYSILWAANSTYRMLLNAGKTRSSNTEQLEKP